MSKFLTSLVLAGGILFVGIPPSPVEANPVLTMCNKLANICVRRCNSAACQHACRNDIKRCAKARNVSNARLFPGVAGAPLCYAPKKGSRCGPKY